MDYSPPKRISNGESKMELHVFHDGHAAKSHRTCPRVWRRIATAILLTDILCTGCVTLDSAFVRKVAPPPVCQVVATWYPDVVFTPDPAHNGEPTPGIGGRMYLFGADAACPLLGDGSIVVDLYDDARVDKDKHPAPLEEWRLDRDTLDRLKRKDAVGWGYTLFLPWGTYRPDLVHVHLRLRYEPRNGAPLYEESGPVVLRTKDGGLHHNVAAASAQPAKPAK
jgi:hypothetical protein